MFLKLFALYNIKWLSKYFDVLSSTVNILIKLQKTIRRNIFQKCSFCFFIYIVFHIYIYMQFLFVYIYIYLYIYIYIYIYILYFIYIYIIYFIYIYIYITNLLYILIFGTYILEKSIKYDWSIFASEQMSKNLHHNSGCSALHGVNPN